MHRCVMTTYEQQLVQSAVIEDRISEALGELFNLSPDIAIDVSKSIGSHVAALVADICATSKSLAVRDRALDRISEFETELDALSEGLAKLFFAQQVDH